MARADIQAGAAYVTIRANNSPLLKGLREAQQSLNAFGSSMLGIGTKIAGMGAAIIAPLAGAVSAASRFEEAFSKFNTVFGDASDAVKKWSDEFAENVGRSKTQMVEFMAGTQDLLVPLGFADDAALGLSKQISQLAVDLASFNNMADADTLRDLQAALTGSGEVMKKYGVIVSQTAVNNHLLAQSIDPKSATEQQKVQARFNIILAGTTAAQGDAIRTAGSYANQMKRLQAILSDTATTIGSALLPAVTKVVSGLSSLLKPIGEIVARNQELVVLLGSTGVALVAAGGAMMGVGVAAKVAAGAVGAMLTVTKAASAAYAAFAAVAGIAKGAVLAVSTALALSTGLAAANTAAWTLFAALQAGYPAIAAVVVGAVNVITASFAGQTIAAGLASLAMTGFSATSSAAAAIGAAFWAVITAPIAPFLVAAGAVVAVVGAIGVAAAIAAARAIDFSGAVSGIKNAMAGAMAIAKDLGGVLMQALSMGDYKTAVEAGWIGIKIAFWSGAEAVVQAFKFMFSEAWSFAKRFFAQLLQITARTMLRVANAIANPLKAGTEVARGLIDVMNTDITFSLSVNAEAAKAELAALKKQMEGAAAPKGAVDAFQAGANVTSDGGAAGDAAEVTKSQLDKIKDIARTNIDGIAAAGDRALAKGMSPQEIARREREMAQQGVEAGRIDQETADQFNEESGKRMFERMERLREEARRLNEELRSPQEILNDRLKKIAQLQATGAIDEKTALSAEDKARLEMAEMQKSIKDKLARSRGESVDGSPGARSQSFATFSAQGAVLAGQGGSGIDKEQLQEAKKTNELIKSLREENMALRMEISWNKGLMVH